MRTRSLAVTAVTALLLAGCASGNEAPAEDPSAVGTVASVDASGDAVALGFAHDPGYEYFEGTVFVIGDDVPVSGAVEDASAIEAGDRINVWTAECAESFPVQCSVTAVEVLD